MSQILHRIFEIEKDNSPLISILLSNRKTSLPLMDELLFHSSGPITDLSEYSFLPSLDSLRILFFEPEKNNYQQTQDSALDGNILLKKPIPLQMLIQELVNNQWSTIKEYRPKDLSEAMEIMESYEIKCNSESKLPIIPGGFAGLLGYDLSRWTNSIFLNHVPKSGSLLGVMWRTEAWWVHERTTNQLHSISFEDHSWSKMTFNDEVNQHPYPLIPTKNIVPDSESDADHARKISQIKEAIVKGNLYQLNYGRTWKGEMPDHPWNSFSRMVKNNPSPFGAWLYVHDHGWAVSSTSPERLIKTEGKIVNTRPIKGTRARGLDEEADLDLKYELISSPKELAEHLMLVDLERNDLTPICVPGTVHWENWRIEALSTVQHLVSGVEGELAPEMTVGDAFVSLFPGGSITGCPKLVTIAAINELEKHPRSAWTGSIGHINFNNKISEWNILIRTLESHSAPNSWYGTVQAGGGIVNDSIPSEEVEESRWKAAAITEATWGFRTGFSGTDLPKRKMTISPIPKVSGPLSKLGPKKNYISKNNGKIIRGEDNIEFSQVIIIDNLDSFTENIANSIANMGKNVRILEGRPIDKIENIDETIKTWIKLYQPSHIIIGPGPSQPNKSQISMHLARMALEGKLSNNNQHIPLLGLCLGHQAIGLAAGWELIESPLGAVHGKPSEIIHDGKGLYRNLPNPITLMRYNSLVLIPKNNSLVETSWENVNNLLMGIRHPSLPVFGIQFHPESVGSPMGNQILLNFINKKPVNISRIYIQNQIKEP